MESSQGAPPVAQAQVSSWAVDWDQKPWILAKIWIQPSWSELVGGQLLKTLQCSHGWEIYVL